MGSLSKSLKRPQVINRRKKGIKNAKANTRRLVEELEKSKNGEEVDLKGLKIHARDLILTPEMLYIHSKELLLKRGDGVKEIKDLQHILAVDENDMTPFYGLLLRMGHEIKEVVIDNGNEFVSRTVYECLELAYEDMCEEAKKAKIEKPADYHTADPVTFRGQGSSFITQAKRGETPMMIHMDDCAFFSDDRPTETEPSDCPDDNTQPDRWTKDIGSDEESDEGCSGDHE